MNVLRGAITIEADTPQEIKENTALLLNALKKENNLTEQNTKAIVFSLTQDIHSYYPAKAARECGFASTALFSAVEPAIDGALPLCIRVMIFTEDLQKEKHVYLKKAATLRKDLTARLNIALDGPAGSGKSTVAKALAKSYQILYLDTGAMYRAVALKFSQDKIDYADEKAVMACLDTLDLQVKYMDGVQHTFLDSKDVSTDIRKNEVSMMASNVSTLKPVREKMVAMQQKVAKEQSCVLDGRDIGTAVLPDTPYKFYITADASIRAERRLKELREKGNTEITLQALTNEIIQRDAQDMNREFSPLRQAKDAVFLDNSHLTIEETVDFIRNKIQEKV